MLYIMRRTQLYLDDQLWNRLHAEAALRGSTISELVREAARERFLKTPVTREAAMRSVVGLWSDRSDLPETEGYIRSLRSGTRRKAELEA